MTGDNPSPQKSEHKPTPTRTHTQPPRTPKLPLSKLQPPARPLSEGAAGVRADDGGAGVRPGEAGVVAKAKSTLQSFARSSPLNSPRSFSLRGINLGGANSSWQQPAASRPASVEISSELTPRLVAYDKDGEARYAGGGAGEPEGTAPSATSSTRAADDAPPVYSALRDSLGSPQAASDAGVVEVEGGGGGGGGGGEQQDETRLTAKIRFEDEITSASPSGSSTPLPVAQEGLGAGVRDSVRGHRDRETASPSPSASSSVSSSSSRSPAGGLEWLQHNPIADLISVVATPRDHVHSHHHRQHPHSHHSHHHSHSHHSPSLWDRIPMWQGIPVNPEYGEG